MKNRDESDEQRLRRERRERLKEIESQIEDAAEREKRNRKRVPVVRMVESDHGTFKLSIYEHPLVLFIDAGMYQGAIDVDTRNRWVKAIDQLPWIVE